MNNARALAQNNGRFRPSGYCLAPCGLGQHVILDAGQVLLDFVGSVQHVDRVGEMRPGLHCSAIMGDPESGAARADPGLGQTT